MKFEVFERLNTGGLALNAQEIRHGLNIGSFNYLLAELERDDSFRAALNIARPRKRMVDRELVLRFFALRDRLSNYRTPLARFLNEYTEAHRNPSGQWLIEHRSTFTNTMDLVNDILGPSAFRVTDSNGKPAERVINRAVYEAQSIIFSICDDKMARRNKLELRRSISALFQDKDFDDRIRSATGDKSRTYGRIEDMAKAFRQAGVEVDLGRLGKVSYPSESR
jgi:hypothetical protein